MVYLLGESQEEISLRPPGRCPVAQHRSPRKGGRSRKCGVGAVLDDTKRGPVRSRLREIL
jgi:hypothetical protein